MNTVDVTVFMVEIDSSVRDMTVAALELAQEAQNTGDTENAALLDNVADVLADAGAKIEQVKKSDQE